MPMTILFVLVLTISITVNFFYCCRRQENSGPRRNNNFELVNTSKMEARVIHDIKHFLQMMIALYFCMYHDFNQLSMLKIMHKQTTNFFSCLYLFLINTQVTAIKSCHWFLINRLISRDMRVRTRHPLYQFMQPVHLQLHGFCVGSVAGEVAPKKEAAMSSIRALTDQVFHSLNVKVCTFQSNFVALNH